MAAAVLSQTQRPSPITPDEVVLLAKIPSSTLPSNVSHSSLLSALQSPSPATPISTYLSSLLGLISRTPPSHSLSDLISSLLLSFIRLLRSHQIPRDKPAADVLHLFSLHLPALDRTRLPALLDLLVSDLAAVADAEDALFLDLLPRCLDLTAVQDNGEAAVLSALDRILTADWSKALLVKMVSLLREFPSLARPRALEFLQKAFSGMDGVDLQDLPSMVYQLLLLASKGFNRKAVVRGVLGFFGGKPLKGAAAVVRQVEGTMLMHVNFVVKQDPSLGQGILRTVKSDIRVFNHFTVLVLMSVARVRRLNEAAMGALRFVVVTAYKDCRFARDCKWLPNSLKEEFLQNLSRVEKSLLKAVDESNCGREHILPSVVQAGFMLLECADNENARKLAASGELLGIEDLSIKILKTLFEVHDMARNEIIEQCKFRILSLKPLQSTAVIKLLGYLVQHYSIPMLDHIARLKELLDYFVFMNEKVALALISALLPLGRFSRDLQDYIILVARKALFRREETIRQAAINSILYLILEENKWAKTGANPTQDSSSQASSSQQADIYLHKGFNLFHELSGLLRRCLSQQAKIKEVMYQGLVKLVILDPLVGGSVFDFLWPHFLQFYKEDMEFPLDTSSCFTLVNDRLSLEEPLDALLSCISWILLLQPQGKGKRHAESSWACFGFSLSQENEGAMFSSGESFSIALHKIRKTLRSDSLKDKLGLGEGSDSLQGEEQHCKFMLLSGVLEVFINVLATELENAADTEKQNLETEIIELIILHESLQDSRLNKHINGGRKRTSDITDCIDQNVPAIKALPSRSFLATSSIYHLLLLAIKVYNSNKSEVATVSSEQCQLPRDNECALRLLSFSLKSFQNQLKFLSLFANDDPFKKLIIGDNTLIAQAIMGLIWSLVAELKLEREQKKKENKVKKSVTKCEEQLLLSFLCLNELFKSCKQKAQLLDLAEKLLSSNIPQTSTENEDDVCRGSKHEQVHVIYSLGEQKANIFLMRIIRPLYLEVLGLSILHETEILVDIITTISNILPTHIIDTHGVWAIGICETIRVENPKVARGLIKVAVQLRSSLDGLDFAQALATELAKVLQMDVTSSLQKSDAYPIINRYTATGIASELLSLVESVITDLDWSLSKLKVMATADLEMGDNRSEHKYGEKTHGLILEETLYSRSEALVKLMSYFTSMNLKDPLSEQLLKLTAKFYKMLSCLTKLQIAPRGCKQLYPAQKFQKLVEVTCRKLTAPLYEFVAVMQTIQKDSRQTKGIINKIKRENKCIPDLIYYIEDYEKYLIKLSKLTKVNLLRHAKRSTARDFKIVEPRQTGEREERPAEEQAHSPANAAVQENESGEDCEGLDDNHEVSPEEEIEEGNDDGLEVEDSDSDKEAGRVISNRKKHK